MQFSMSYTLTLLAMWMAVQCDGLSFRRSPLSPAQRSIGSNLIVSEIHGRGDVRIMLTQHANRRRSVRQLLWLVAIYT